MKQTMYITNCENNDAIEIVGESTEQIVEYFENNYDSDFYGLTSCAHNDSAVSFDIIENIEL